ncbi:MAG: DNA repair protein RadC [Anaerolineae bacterium]
MGTKTVVSEAQLTFLPPDDAEFVHLLRRFLAEASRIYEARTGQPSDRALQISSPRDAYEFFRFEMEGLAQEQMRVMTLDTKNRIISCVMVYQGTINQSPVRLSEVFRPAILDNAANIIVAHNHPSGEPTPSHDDVKTTRALVQAGELLGITVLDHLVIGRGSFVSMKERGLGF